MGTKGKSVEIVEILDDDDDYISITIPGNQIKQAASGANKEEAISVESYCQTMKNSDSKKRVFSDLFHEIQENPDQEVQVLDSFSFHNRNPRSRITINSIFELGESSDTRSGSLSVCEICVNEKLPSEFFSINGCSHSYCTDCIRKYIASKLLDNITQITCPVLGCLGLLEPEDCRLILPREVFDRWGKALCEAVILDSQKFYCPYRDCSAMLINDDGEMVALSNCQYCERDFCVQCNVPWHLGMDCKEFQSLNENEREAEDIMLMQLAKNCRWYRCPNCRFYIEKFAGCSYVKCRYCLLLDTSHSGIYVNL